jgi:hypothetical protein
MFGMFAVGFTELRNMPDSARFVIVLVGAIAIPAGGELGTVSSVIEIFRKHYHNRGTTRLDWIGLCVSMVSSMVGLVLSWAYLLETDLVWTDEVKIWGPLVYGMFCVADFVFSLLEMGAYIGEKEREFDKWRVKKFDPWIEEREAQANKPGIPYQSPYSDPYNEYDHETSTLERSTLSPTDEAKPMPRHDERFDPEIMQDNGTFHPVVARTLARIGEGDKTK